jgi:hypothetical protein
MSTVKSLEKEWYSKSINITGSHSLALEPVFWSITGTNFQPVKWDQRFQWTDLEQIGIPVSVRETNWQIALISGINCRYLEEISKLASVHCVGNA